MYIVVSKITSNSDDNLNFKILQIKYNIKLK